MSGSAREFALGCLFSHLLGTALLALVFYLVVRFLL